MRLSCLSAFALAALAACGLPGGGEDPGAGGNAGDRPGATFADVVIHGGPIHTGVENDPIPDFVAISGGRIAAVGNEAAMAEHVGSRTRVIDLAGAALFPGFVDAHAHLIGIGERELTLNLEGVSSVAELVERIEVAIADAEPGAAVIGRGWIETGWPEGRFPSRTDIDPVSPDNPVILVRADGHALLANSVALNAAGVTDATRTPEGGRIETDTDGAPTGMLIDGAMTLVSTLIDEPDEDRKREYYRAGARVYAEYGWTGVHNMSVDPRDTPIMSALSDAGEMGIRVYNAIDVAGLDDVSGKTPQVSKDGRIVTRSVKLYVDGALGSRGAALSEPYADAPSTDGLLQMDEDTALAAYAKAIENDVQVATHAIGDRGNSLVLDWYEKAFAAARAAGRNAEDRRWRIEHAQILHVEDIPRFAQLGVIASMQPSHAIGDLYFAPDRLGPDRLDGAYAWRSLLDAGAVIAGGSDAPVERGDPAIEFYAAVARRGVDGFYNEDWRPGEAVTRADALAMFTTAPAFASFMEDELGTIEVGKKADLTAFSIDLMTAPTDDLLKAKARLTVVDGEILFENLSAATD
ncbi:MAG: amidohydrolase family protein [Alphaproteobacteria bacterium]|nr:amidohydrolase family protein [Alphaproteobacteria bacterium]